MKKQNFLVGLLAFFMLCSASCVGPQGWYSSFEHSDENSSSSNSSNNESNSTSGDVVETYLYNAFTATQKHMFIEAFGEVIPFVANNEYYVEPYMQANETGINFYTFGNTLAEFNAYHALFKTNVFLESYEDEYGDTWYSYQMNGYCVDLAYYEVEDDTCIDVYAYTLTGGSGGNTDTPENVEVLKNDGKGLPKGVNGVYGVDFNAATYVKNVTQQGIYEYGCPPVGNPGVLVVPVDFSDATAQSKGYDISVLKNAFEKDGKTDYYSVYDYYRISSYGQLEIDVTVADSWFRPQYASSYYQKQTMNYYGEQVAIGDQMIMNEALAHLSKSMDLSKFDSDNNGTIDAVVLVTTLDVAEDDFHWAYRYWNIYTDGNDEYYEYDGVYANDYLWASYQFLHEGYNKAGEVIYTDKNAVNTYTYIHEFGHILGADDYYDTAGMNSPMGGYDIMDGMIGDHNAFTKFNLGWVTTSRLVTTDTSITLELEDFSKNGDTIILANHWDPALGAYQEYFIVAYYRSAGLNDGKGGYFSRDGIVVYHVNASLYKETIEGEVYYDVYNNNTSAFDEYGTEDDLLEYVLNKTATYTYAVGDGLSTVKDDSGNALGYTFTVDALDGEIATLTFRKVS